MIARLVNGFVNETLRNWRLRASFGVAPGDDHAGAAAGEQLGGFLPYSGGRPGSPAPFGPVGPSHPRMFEFALNVVAVQANSSMARLMHWR